MSSFGVPARKWKPATLLLALLKVRYEASDGMHICMSEACVLFMGFGFVATQSSSHSSFTLVFFVALICCIDMSFVANRIMLSFILP